jgi:hypothetical protein
MTHAAVRPPRGLGLAILFSCLLLTGPASAAPVTLEFSGTIFGVFDPSDVFVTTSPNTYSLFVTWDPVLLTGTPSGDATIYETLPGETSITFSFLSGAGEFFASDNSFPARVRVENHPPGTQDRFSIEGNFAPNLELQLVMVESLAVTNPLSSNDLPTTGFGSGPGTWFVSELDIDRIDLFANISGSVVDIVEVTSVPEPATGVLLGLGMLSLIGLRHHGIHWLIDRHRRRAAPMSGG